MDLCNPEHTPRIPRLIRDTARSLLRHYPSEWDLDRAAEACPDVFQQRMEDLHRFVAQGVQQHSAEWNPEVNQPHREQD